LLVSIILIAFPTLGGSLPKKGKEVLLDVLSPVQGFVSLVIEKARRVGDHYILLTNKEEENDDLRRLVEELSAKYDTSRPSISRPIRRTGAGGDPRVCQGITL